MRICMVISSDILYPNIDPRPYKEAKSLISAGYEVYVLTYLREIPKAWPLKQNFEGIKIIRVKEPESGASSFFSKAMRQRKTAKYIGKKVAELKPDFIHCHDYTAIPAGIEAKKILNVPLIYDAHEDFPSQTAEFGKMLGLAAAFIEWVYFMPHVDYVLTGNFYTAKRLGKMRKSLILFNARPLADFKARPPKGLRKKLGLEKYFLIGHVGSAGPSSGIDNAIYALKYLPSDVRMLFVGGRKEHVDLLKDAAKKAGVEDRVIFYPSVPFKKVCEYYKIMDAGIALYLPFSRNNIIGVPNKIFEYMGSGLPLIVSDYENRRELVANNGCGVLVNPEDPKDIAEKMLYLYRHPEERKKMSKNCIKAHETKYCWDLQEKKLLKFYGEVANARKRS